MLMLYGWSSHLEISALSRIVAWLARDRAECNCCSQFDAPVRNARGVVKSCAMAIAGFQSI
jgi:hypothetical protein